MTPSDCRVTVGMACCMAPFYLNFVSDLEACGARGLVIGGLVTAEILWVIFMRYFIPIQGEINFDYRHMVVRGYHLF